MDTRACDEHMIIGCRDCIQPWSPMTGAEWQAVVKAAQAEHCIYCGRKTYVPGHGCDSCGMATVEDIGEDLSDD